MDGGKRAMWKSAVVAVSFFAINCGTLHAQELGAKDCFSIMVPPPVGNQSPPGVAIYGMIGSILINKCTGQTWILVKSTVAKDSSAFRWFPVSVTNGEALWPGIP
jgi:hypothetical protein